MGSLWLSQSNMDYLRLMDSLELPRWIFPSFAGDSPSQWRLDPLLTQFLGRVDPGQPVPYGAWIVPILAWGVFLLGLFGALMFLVTIVRRQWFENERLPFPLAQIRFSTIWIRTMVGSRI